MKKILSAILLTTALFSLTACNQAKPLDSEKPVTLNGEMTKYYAERYIEPSRSDGFLVKDFDSIKEISIDHGELKINGHTVQKDGLEVLFGNGEENFTPLKLTQADIDDLKYFTKIQDLTIKNPYEDLDFSNLNKLSSLKKLNCVAVNFKYDMSKLNNLQYLENINLLDCNFDFKKFSNPATKTISIDYSYRMPKENQKIKLKDLYSQMKLGTVDSPVTVIYKPNSTFHDDEYAEWKTEWDAAREKFSKDVVKRNK